MKLSLISTILVLSSGFLACVGANASESTSATPTDVDAGSWNDSAMPFDREDAGARTTTDAKADVTGDAASVACDSTAPFGAPLLVPGLAAIEGASTPRLSNDELTIYFQWRGPDGGTTTDLYQATRVVRADPFGVPVPVAAQNTADDELHPMISADGKLLFFDSPRADGPGGFDIRVATRSNTSSEFGPSGILNGVNSNVTDTYPFLRADGAELWFVSNRPGTVAPHLDIYRASFNGSVVSDVTLATELVTDKNEFSPVISHDGLTIFWSSDRADGGAKGGTDIWTAHRASPTAPFTDVKTVPEINTTADEEPGWLSADGCRLYSWSSMGGVRLYVSSRP